MKHCPNPDCPHWRAVGSPAEFVDETRTTCSDCGMELVEAVAEREYEARGPVPHTLPWRLAITVAAPVLAVLASFVPVPGFDAGRVVEGAPFLSELAPVSVVHLGLWPVLQAAFLVELAALAVPRWRPSRVTAEGRKRLWRATLVLAMVHATWSAFGVAPVEEWLYTGGLFPRLLVVVTLLAGTSALLALSALVSARGLAPGLAVVGLAGAVPDVRALLFQIQDQRALTPQVLAYFVGPIVVTLLATAWILRAHGRIARTVVVDDDVSPQEAAGPYRGRRPPEPGQLPTVRVPASGVVPLWILPASAAIFDSVASSTSWVGLVEKSRVAITPLVTLLFVLGSGMALSLVGAAPLRLSRLWARVTDRTWEPIDERRSRALRRPTLKLTFAYLALIALLSSTGGVGIWLLLFAAVAVGVIYDVRGEWRARHAHGDGLTTVAEEHQVEVADAAKLALGRAGIAAHVRGIHVRALLRILGPFAPMEVMVPQQAAADAKKVLGKVLASG